ncbi:MAG TPA: zinc-binding dehydrogenase [Rhizomicrobium sp.]|jgi:(R,R)-butanediol dehydrogenase/meso-butanediol dehydrogenase/diacetyl reductase|nr:zinc-binding dehydrogenase [Rhizomicrobium sp.]
MRAAVFKEVSKPLAIETVADPTPRPTDIIIKVKNCGICGSDLHMTEKTSIMPLPAGSVMGHEFAGEVIEVGSAVKHLWKPGDRLAGFPVICCGDATPCLIWSGRGLCTKMTPVGLGQAPGAYAEYVRIGTSNGYKLPDSVTFREGAMVEPLAVGLHAVDMAKMPRGATVLVIGAGPVGLAVMLWAKFLGARHVIVSEKAPVRQEMAARFGATDCIDPSQPLSPQVEKIAGKGPDIIFECVGVPGLLMNAMAEAPRGGRIVVAGVCQQADTIMPLMGIMKELELQFVLGYRPADFDYVIAMIASDRIDVGHMITDIVTLDTLPEAFEALRKPSHQCKVMLEN